MPFNLPTVDKDSISFGPGRLFLGVSGTTPSVDVGAISEDGITCEITADKREIRQGNPKLLELAFCQAQDVLIKVTSIEWDFTALAYALGAGNTTASGSEETFSYGGDPLVDEIALHVQHQMAQAGHTLDVYAWTAQSESGVTLPFSHDEHSFEYSWKVQRSDSDWAGNSLARDEQLIKIVRQTA